MLRREVLDLNATFSNNVKSNRSELIVRGAGNDLAESRRALDWMGYVLEHPDWRPENLPRIRDLVAQQMASLRSTMQGSEEQWVMNPVVAYWKQSNPLYLTTASFLTRAYNADRLRWMLADTGTESRASLAIRIGGTGSNAHPAGCVATKSAGDGRSACMAGGLEGKSGAAERATGEAGGRSEERGDS